MIAPSSRERQAITLARELERWLPQLPLYLPGQDPPPTIDIMRRAEELETAQRAAGVRTLPPLQPLTRPRRRARNGHPAGSGR
jgi:hypothetical protein